MAPPLGELAPARVTERVATFEILDTSLPSLPLQGTSPNGEAWEIVNCNNPFSATILLIIVETKR